MRVLHWFRNDLRVYDHPVMDKYGDAELLLPVYIIDPKLFKETHLGFPRTGKYRFSFLMESLADLRNSLRERGSDLFVRIGNPVHILRELVKEFDVNVITAIKEYTSEEMRMEEQVSSIPGSTLELFHSLTLYHPNDLPMDIERVPDVFTNFRKKVEKYSDVRPIHHVPNSLPSFPSNVNPGDFPDYEIFGLTPPGTNINSAFPFQGGESKALDRIDDYIFRRKLISQYKYTRNKLIGEYYSSKFSPWLANGSLSPRMVYQEVKKYEEDYGSNISTYWLIFELIWRDYFKYVAMKHGSKIFMKGGIMGNDPGYSNDIEAFRSWTQGTTGEEFVDANMKELYETGFMSNRGRQNVASFLCKDLGVDWRWGAMWFESQLIDYDAASNWGNWMYVAGVGNDPRKDRYFNVKKQAERYDPEGKYVRLWSA